MDELILIFIFTGSAVLTGVMRHYAESREILDVPNDRSSHTVPTPRGGGVAIVFMVLLAVAWLSIGGRLLPLGMVPALVLGGTAVALVGWTDDHYPLSAMSRVAAYLLAAAWAVHALGGMSSFDLGFTRWQPGNLIGSAAAVLFIAWLTNLYNFMDGTDGIAGTQAVCAGMAGFALFLARGQPGLGMLSLAVAAAAAGFLLWNWPPARIFMGDVGSCFLGYVFGVLALAGEKSGAAPAILWTVILGVFFWDATFTLARRMLAGDRWYRAHRTHAYQRLTQLGWSHRRIAVAMLVYNVVVLWPLVWLGTLWNNNLMSVVGLSAALFGVVWVAVHRRHQRHGGTTSS
jgi:Fuc2NAc and GlcNAc transferase